MNIIGKIVGLVVGGLVMRMHPIGLIVGLIIGHLVDTGIFRGAGVAAPTRAGFLKPLFALFGALAKSDGRVSENEIAAVEFFMQRMQLGREERKRAIDAFNLGKQVGFDFNHAARELREFINFQAELKAASCEMMVRLIEADGEPAQVQLDLTRSIIRMLGLGDDLLDQLRYRERNYDRADGQRANSKNAESARAQDARGRSRIADPYAVLGVAITATDSEVRRAYRKLITQFHPDKLAKNISEKDRKDAEIKAREINAAYEQIQTMKKMRR